MKQIIQTIGAAAIAVVVGFTSFTATAAPIATRAHIASDVELAQYRHSDHNIPRWKKRQHDRQQRVEGRRDRRHDRAEQRHDRRHDRVERHQRQYGYWNGHRGYREYRRGYRRHSDGFYYSNDVFQLFLR
jgi:hypothetical protein